MYIDHLTILFWSDDDLSHSNPEICVLFLMLMQLASRCIWRDNSYWICELYQGDRYLSYWIYRWDKFFILISLACLISMPQTIYPSLYHILLFFSFFSRSFTLFNNIMITSRHNKRIFYQIINEIEQAENLCND